MPLYRNRAGCAYIPRALSRLPSECRAAACGSIKVIYVYLPGGSRRVFFGRKGKANMTMVLGLGGLVRCR